MLKALSALFACILFGSAAYATPPCMPRNVQWFQDNVAKQSDVAVYAQIKDFSQMQDVDEAAKKGWTKVHVIEELFGRSVPAELTIQGWQANLFPFYGYKKGDYIVLWLRRDNNAFIPTNMEWKACTPSVWYANKNAQAAPMLEPFSNKGYMPLHEIEDTLGIMRK